MLMAGLIPVWVVWLVGAALVFSIMPPLVPITEEECLEFEYNDEKDF